MALGIALQCFLRYRAKIHSSHKVGQWRGLANVADELEIHGDGSNLVQLSKDTLAQFQLTLVN